MFVKNRFYHFRTFPWLLKKYAKSKQIYMCFNIHHFGIAKRKVMGSKLQVTPTKLQVTPTKLQVTPTKLQVTLAKLQVTPTKLQVTLTKLQVTLTKLQVTSTKLQVTRSKLTSLRAETKSYNFLKRCFECTVNGSLQMVVATFNSFVLERYV